MCFLFQGAFFSLQPLVFGGVNVQISYPKTCCKNSKLSHLHSKEVIPTATAQIHHRATYLAEVENKSKVENRKKMELFAKRQQSIRIVRGFFAPEKTRIKHPPCFSTTNIAFFAIAPARAMSSASGKLTWLSGLKRSTCREPGCSPVFPPRVLNPTCDVCVFRVFWGCIFLGGGLFVEKNPCLGNIPKVSILLSDLEAFAKIPLCLQVLIPNFIQQQRSLN